MDDELWGEIRYVTAYHAYVKLGAKVDGSLHFMDYLGFGKVPKAPMSDFMKVGGRVQACKCGHAMLT